MNHLALSFLLLAACESGGSEPTVDASMTGSGGSTSPDAPKILSLNTNLTTMTTTDKLVVSAVVTDPDGIDDLIGGNLTTPDGGAAYGAFATSAGEGAYSITLTWADINAAAPISTEINAKTSRVFRASFYDVAGHTVYREVTVNLGCAGNLAACNGMCSPVDTDDSCGSCGHACPLPGASECYSENVQVPMCLSVAESQARVACTSLCVAPYGKCRAAYALYKDDFGEYWSQIPCVALPPATDAMRPFSTISCICSEP